MSIYYIDPKAGSSANPKPYEQIGLLWGQLLLRSAKENPSILEQLGISPTDKIAKQSLEELTKNLFSPTKENPYRMNPNVTISGNKDCPASIIFSLNGKKFATFKSGEKRAYIELLVRQIAHKLGLEKHAIPGSFCVMMNQDFYKTLGDADDGEEISIELWQKGLKVLSRAEEKEKNPPFFMAGILEPWLEEQKEADQANFAKMLTLCIALGINDAKSDGYIGSTLIDSEAIMPKYLVPSKEKWNILPSALHMPLLEDKKCKEPLSKETIEELYKIISKWDLLEIGNAIKQQEIPFVDQKAETTLPKEDDDAQIILDSGNYPCKIVFGDEKILEKIPSVDVKITKHAFNQAQTNAFMQRLSAIKSFIEKNRSGNTPFSLLELVCHVDLHYKDHYEKFILAQSPTPPPNSPLLVRGAEQISPTSAVGRFTPNQTFALPSPPTLGLPPKKGALGAVFSPIDPPK